MEMLNIAASLSKLPAREQAYGASEDGAFQGTFSDAIRQEVTGSSQNKGQGAGQESAAEKEPPKELSSELQNVLLWTAQMPAMQGLNLTQVPNLQKNTATKAEGMELQTIPLREAQPQMESRHIAELSGTGKPEQAPAETGQKSALQTQLSQPAANAESAQPDAAAGSRSVKEQEGSMVSRTETAVQKDVTEGLSGQKDTPVSRKETTAAQPEQTQTAETQIPVRQAEAEGFRVGMQQSTPAEQATGRSAPTSNLENLSETMLKQMSQGRKEFEILLEPEHLGKLTVKVAYESGKAAISIICSNDKTMELLSQNAKTMGAIVEQRMGSETTVVVENHPNPDYLQQDGKQENSSGYQQEEHAGRQDREKENEHISFAEQLRLGLM